MTKPLFHIVVSFLLGISLFSVSMSKEARAEPVVVGELNQAKSKFTTPKVLEPYVDFWKLVFTKYGKYQLVFHHREHPGIIYSVLDFSDYVDSLGENKLAAIKERETEAEIARIQSALKELEVGTGEKSAFVRRIERLYSLYYPGRREVYREAREIRQIRSQTGVRERFADGIRRSGAYMHAIERILREEGVPAEVGRLPLVESSFDLSAYSSVGAAGIWQFMRATGKKYMRIDSYVDERRDPLISTRAAGKYLHHAHNVLGSWPLAITSYNHGITGVSRAVKATGSRDLGAIVRKYRGTSFGFASQNFYAEFLAALEIEQNFQTYFPDLKRDRVVSFDEVRLQKSVSARSIMNAVRLDEEEFSSLNPALLKPILSGRASVPSGFRVKVPSGKGTKLLAALGSGSISDRESGELTAQTTTTKPKSANKGSAKQKVIVVKNNVPVAEVAEAGVTSSERYTIQPGDTPGSIAKKFSVSTAELLKFNSITNPKKIRAGKTLNIPVTAKKQSSEQAQPITEAQKRQNQASPTDNTENTQRKRHRVQKGDNLSKIGKLYKVPVQTLRKLNPGRTDKLKPGEELYVE